MTSVFDVYTQNADECTAGSSKQMSSEEKTPKKRQRPFT
jgi:hypothetical protein